MSLKESEYSGIAVTVDLDWACEPAIEYTLGYLDRNKIPYTVFTTHNSKAVEKRLNNIEVGLHPFFHPDSSHGAGINDVVNHITSLNYNLKAYRCHRFSVSNEIKDVMKKAGMLISSNVCTDISIVKPFYDRFQVLEVPVFLEDGSYLLNEHPLIPTDRIKLKLIQEGLKVIVIHPMHFAINTPEWDYMLDIKQKHTWEEWNAIAEENLDKLKSNKLGIRNFLENLFEHIDKSKLDYVTIGKVSRKFSDFFNG
ncbi:MAG TPA: hypothetical protein VFJ43_11470 [Bacteroidia bacterium]|nr:hypothetical protein [Bacteroidia bacterium]